MRWGAVAAFCGLLLLPVMAAGQEDLSNDTCLACHGTEGFTDAEGHPISVDAGVFEASVHAALPCTSCHTDITTVPHEGEVKQPGAEVCATCHEEIVAKYRTSIHGVANGIGEKDAATCASCHGSPHAIREKTDPESMVYPLKIPTTCGVCHGDPMLAARHDIPVADAYQLYMDSIHGRGLLKSGLLVTANCASCHGSHDIRPESDPASKVNRNNIPKTCGACHAGVEEEYFSGVHGQAVKAGNLKAPVCMDCHTAHKIARVDTEAWKLRIVSECGTCHVDQLRTYRDTLHGQVSALGFTVAARCSDCHGFHRVLPASNPESTIASGNLVTTCRTCHAGANERFVKFMPHADPEDSKRNPGLYFTALAMNLLIIGVFIFFGAHTILWFGRSLMNRFQLKNPPRERE